MSALSMKAKGVGGATVDGVGETEEVKKAAESGCEFNGNQLEDTSKNTSEGFNTGNTEPHNPRAKEVEQDLANRPCPASEVFTPSAPFEYFSLPERHFRLLRVQRVGTTPEVEMNDYSMDEAPLYAAISYAWGKERSSRLFICNGKSFAVSSHVLDALNNLDRESHRRFLWIDAICINQQDEAEKADQVAAMERIYRQAEEVLVWLGPEENNSGLVFDNIPSITSRALQKARGTDPIPEDPLEFAHQTSLSSSLGHIYARPWFHRVWVVQELLLARNPQLICGDRRVDWEAFTRMTVLLMSRTGVGWMESPDVSPQKIEIGARNVFSLLDIKLKDPGQDQFLCGLPIPEFVELLNDGRWRQVTEPVDRVWAYLGLVSPEIREAAKPWIDYSPEGRRDYGNAYTSLAKLLLPRDPDLTLLGSAPSLRRPEGLPTWCPNFQSPSDCVSPIQFPNHPFTASGPKGGGAVATFEISTNILKLKGFRVDRVDKIVKIDLPQSHSWEEEAWTYVSEDDVVGWETECLKLACDVYSRPSTASAPPEAHLRTLCFGDESPNRDLPAMNEAYFNFLYFSQGSRRGRERYLASPARENMINYRSGVQSSSDRSYFSTLGGRVGLGPRRLEAGDWVVILYGARVPHVLRVESGSTHATLVGDCYTHGIMYGEALKAADRCEDEIFLIT